MCFVSASIGGCIVCSISIDRVWLFLGCCRAVGFAREQLYIITLKGILS